MNLSPTTDVNSLRTYLLVVAEYALGPDLRSKTSPSDLVQQTFLVAHRAADDFRGSSRGELRSWFRRILMTTLSNLRRSFTRHRRCLAREQSLISEAVVGPVETPSHQAGRTEENQILRDAVDRLPHHYRNVVLFHIEEGCTFAEIGRRLGCSEDAIRMTWHRALTRLRTMLDAGKA